MSSAFSYVQETLKTAALAGAVFITFGVGLFVKNLNGATFDIRQLLGDAHNIMVNVNDMVESPEHVRKIISNANVLLSDVHGVLEQVKGNQDGEINKALGNVNVLMEDARKTIDNINEVTNSQDLKKIIDSVNAVVGEVYNIAYALRNTPAPVYELLWGKRGLGGVKVPGEDIPEMTDFDDVVSIEGFFDEEVQNAGKLDSIRNWFIGLMPFMNRQ